MARRASRDPESLLRAHFAAEIAAARREASPPRLEPGIGIRSSDAGADLRGRGARQGSLRAWPGELATAAALILAFGLGAWKAPAETGLSRAIAENTLERGRALEVGTIVGQGVSAAVNAFSRSVQGGSGAVEASRNARFK